MKISKGAVVGVALLASLAFVAGCKGSGGGDTTSPGGTTASSAPAKPAADELKDAVTKLSTTSSTFVMETGPAKINGASDPANKAVKMNVNASEGSQSVSIDIVAVGTDYYLKLSGLPIPGIEAGKYMHLDGTKVKSLAQFGVENLSDPTNTAQLAKQFDTVEKTGEGKYKGTMDISKSPGVDQDTLKNLGDKAKAIPFEATVDSEGRLTSLSFTVPATSSTPALPSKVTYKDFGSATKVEKPAASEVVEAPASIYGMFG